MIGHTQPTDFQDDLIYSVNTCTKLPLGVIDVLVVVSVHEVGLFCTTIIRLLDVTGILTAVSFSDLCEDIV